MFSGSAPTLPKRSRRLPPFTYSIISDIHPLGEFQ
jgi:hypothetical protein